MQEREQIEQVIDILITDDYEKNKELVMYWTRVLDDLIEKERKANTDKLKTDFENFFKIINK